MLVGGSKATRADHMEVGGSSQELIAPRARARTLRWKSSAGCAQWSGTDLADLLLACYFDVLGMRPGSLRRIG
jgi:hypothetical protein